LAVAPVSPRSTAAWIRPMHVVIRSRQRGGVAGARQTPPAFTGRSWDTGEVALPSLALGFLADHGIRFTVMGPASYRRLTSLRDTGAVAA